MWRNPGLILETRVTSLQLLLSDNPEGLRHYPRGNWGIGFDSIRGHQYLQDIHRSLVGLLETNDLRELNFKRSLKRLFIELAKEIEKTRDYSIFPSLSSALGELLRDNMDFGTMAWVIYSTIRVLVGSEERQLIGTRGGRPAWKTLRRPITRSITQPDDPIFLYTLDDQMRYLDASDVDLMPDPDEWIDSPVDNFNWPSVEISQVREIFERAYYNQRYIVHPEGAYVKLRHFDPIKRVVLKVKSPGLLDPNFVDFLVQFEFDTSGMDTSAYGFSPGPLRKGLVAFDGAFLTGQLTLLGPGTKGLTYLAWVTALIYHDLVTAQEVAGTRRIGRRGQGPGAEPPEEPTWVYIPRKIRRRLAPPRIPSDNPRFITPHHVRGHRRRGNPTERHLRELEEFERQTGLRVLDLLRRNPGYTFVRPHISPSEEGLRDLPRFIHARLQSDIERLMRGLPVNGN